MLTLTSTAANPAILGQKLAHLILRVLEWLTCLSIRCCRCVLLSAPDHPVLPSSHRQGTDRGGNLAFWLHHLHHHSLLRGLVGHQLFVRSLPQPFCEENRRQQDWDLGSGTTDEQRPRLKGKLISIAYSLSAVIHHFLFEIHKHRPQLLVL